MSILIKGMDMPKDCSYCILANKHINGLCEAKYYCRLEADYEHCPLIEIPTPHGRLIDGDEFKSWVDDWYDCTDIGNIVESWIDERPTILEAEE